MADSKSPIAIGVTTTVTCKKLRLTPAVSIAAAHAAGSKWAAAWSQSDPSVWADIYTADAMYTDYAFGFVRRGKDGLKEHIKIWRDAHPDFYVTIVEAWPGIDLGEGMVKYSIRTSNVGTFTNDLPIQKASGKKFDFYAVVDLVVKTDDGLIVKVDEWYHRQFDYQSLPERDAS